MGNRTDPMFQMELWYLRSKLSQCRKMHGQDLVVIAKIQRRDRTVCHTAVQEDIQMTVGCHQRHIHAAITKQLGALVHILPTVSKGAVFIFYRHQDHIAAVCLQVGTNFLHKHLHIPAHMGKIPLLGGAQTNAVIRQKPGRQAAELPFRADIGAGTDDHIQSQLFRKIKKCGNIQHTLKAEFPLLRLVHIPAAIGFYSVQAAVLQFLQPILPLLGQRAEIVDRTAVNLKWRPIHIELSVLISKHIFYHASF